MWRPGRQAAISKVSDDSWGSNRTEPEQDRGAAKVALDRGSVLVVAIIRDWHLAGIRVIGTPWRAHGTSTVASASTGPPQ